MGMGRATQVANRLPPAPAALLLPDSNPCLQTASEAAPPPPRPFCSYFGWKIISNKMKNSPNVNERFSIVQEVLPAMKLVK